MLRMFTAGAFSGAAGVVLLFFGRGGAFSTAPNDGRMAINASREMKIMIRWGTGRSPFIDNGAVFLAAGDNVPCIAN